MNTRPLIAALLIALFGSTFAWAEEAAPAGDEAKTEQPADGEKKEGQ